MPVFSIDLNAELAKITQRQYLNRVHYLIGLVRFALAHEPNGIEIQVKGLGLSLNQDGVAPDPEHWRLLDTLLKEPAADVAARQQALSVLESRFGVTILSLVLNSKSFQIRTATHELNAVAGKLEVLEKPSDVRGFAIRLTRAEKPPANEFKELAYYCAGATAPISYNHRQLTQPITLDDQILVLKFKDELGEGVVGIPLQGDSCRLVFYKNGVRLGVKQFAPAGGRTLEGYWNSSIRRFETDYRETIDSGENRLLRYGKQLYKAIPLHFNQMDPERKARIKELLLGLRDDKWSARFGSVPLFGAYRRPFTITAMDLIRSHARFGAVLYRRNEEVETPAHIPICGSDDLFFISERLGLEVRLLTRPLQGNPYSQRPRPTMTDPGDAAQPEEDIRCLLTQLNRLDAGMRFRYTDAQPRMEQSPAGVTTWFLPKHSLLEEAAAVCKDRPELLLAYRYRLIDLVER